MWGWGRGKLRKGRKVKGLRACWGQDTKTHRDSKRKQEQFPRGKGMVVTAKIWVSPRILVGLMRERQKEGAGREGWLVQGSKHRS